MKGYIYNVNNPDIDTLVKKYQEKKIENIIKI